MRLICPNCGAQYEVADDVIPPGGRDVQCSACNHTWFERPGASLEEEAEAETTGPAADADTGNAQADDAGAEAKPDAEAAGRAPVAASPAPPAPEIPEPDAPILAADLDPYDDADADAPLPPPVPAARAAMRTVSPEIAEILRQEAAREEAARRAEAAAGVEIQPDLGLDALIDAETQRADDARRRLARLRGAAEALPPQGTADPAPNPVAAATMTAAVTRRERLPDIEEINSTLRSATERGAVAEQETMRATENQRRGFRLGYGAVLLVAGALGLVYAFAPRIIVVVPQTEPFLLPYVAAIDDGRLWLDLKLQGILSRIEEEPAAQGS